MQQVNIKRADGGADLVDVYTVEDFPYTQIDKKRKLIVHKKKDLRSYLQAFATFDIETSTIDDGFNAPWGFMYHWQMCVDGVIIIGRYWEEWLDFIKKLQDTLQFDFQNRLVCYIHNAGYEFQFIYDFLKEYFGTVEIFASQPRKPIKITTGIGIEFRCSYKLTNMSLAKATKNELGVLHIKAENDLDYKKLRTPKTILDETELGYCVSDVVSLYEMIDKKQQNERDDLESIPITSTGYVRRDCRRACRKDKKYRERVFLKQRMSEDVYTMLKEESRGGNTHCNRRWSGHIADATIHGAIDSYDFASSYPAQQLLFMFPCSKFEPYGEIESKAELDELLGKYACLFHISFDNIKVKESVSMPYIPTAKCLQIYKGRYDNGRVLSAESLTLTANDIDYGIIVEQYEFQNIYVSDMYTAKYDYLPQALTGQIMEYFRQKCVLKEEIEELERRGETDTEHYKNQCYLYAKSKNRLNGIFGMTFTDPVRESILYNETTGWSSEKPNISESLEKYYKSRNSFLVYAWGCWTTARARAHLQRLINITDRGCDGDGTIYCDTDSSKCVGVDKQAIEKFNQEIIALCEKRGAYVDVNGKRFYLGVAECETESDAKKIKRFKSLGAKKYAYEDGKGLHVTISGVSKTHGAEELKTLENFDIGFTFVKAGGSTLYYNDNVGIHKITVNGETFTSASNIGMIDSTYTIGITNEYADLIGIEYNVFDN